jgi:hypothetical protein
LLPKRDIFDGLSIFWDDDTRFLITYEVTTNTATTTTAAAGTAQVTRDLSSIGAWAFSNPASTKAVYQISAVSLTAALSLFSVIDLSTSFQSTPCASQ